MTARLFGIIGWKNSGKTTLTERLVTELTRRGWRVSTVKHATSRLRHRQGRRRQLSAIARLGDRSRHRFRTPLGADARVARRRGGRASTRSSRAWRPATSFSWRATSASRTARSRSDAFPRARRCRSPNRSVHRRGRGRPCGGNWRASAVRTRRHRRHGRSGGAGSRTEAALRARRS